MLNNTGNIIFYRAYTQYENLGDIIIHKTLIRRLRNYGSLIIDDIGVPDWYCQELGLESEERASQYGYNGTQEEDFWRFMLLVNLKSIIKLNFKKMYFVLSPGNDAMGWGRWKSAKRVLYSFWLATLEVRIVRFGVSIGPFTRQRELVEKLSSKFMYFYSVRDSISRNYAKSIGINNVYLFPDLAWLMEKPASHNLIRNSGEEDYVIFSFRSLPISKKDLTKSDFSTPESLCSVLDEIVKLVCGQWSKKLIISYQVTRDHDFCKELADRYTNLADVVFIEKQIDSQSMYDLYSRALMVFSNRLHVLMFAMACGSLPVAVVDAAVQHKVTGIFSDVGLMQLVIDIGKGTSAVESLPGIVDEADKIKEKMASCYKNRRQEGEDLLQKVMTGKIQ
ncbi:polysaccharide pyruvyl transferase family protein [Coleofasciculus sp. G2-EDA-02]|uniref:polysaccharide pyruvyl transferase family protein n=1 Tax=Coleofasciculus sp. G2-EDA-02 TaxID=3069529 RepID=UPI0032F17E78